ncbi:uncharacterized protein LOC117120125 [Anneissia japonica]|uniref:uncharacterized protein LOC117120125 n=1 Tax=Anneissia japonica TaxID=1529436 RepID=UPI0014259553|nr:uncharacterized protein LOC117120125 [Anneissia japonica]
MFIFSRRKWCTFKRIILFLVILCNFRLIIWLSSNETILRNGQLKALFSSGRNFLDNNVHMPTAQPNCSVQNSSDEDEESCFLKNKLLCEFMPTIHSVFADYRENRVVFIGITYFGNNWSTKSFLCEFPNGNRTVTDAILNDGRSFGATPQYVLVITCPFPDEFLNSSFFSQQRFYINLRRKELPSVAYVKIPICASHKTLNEKKKHSLIICTMAKDMDHFFPTWLDFHLHIGVDHVYIYDNSKRGSLSNALSRYLANGFVSVIPWAHEHTPWKTYLEVQIAHENDCVWRNKHTSEWIIKIDVDEFLQPMNPDKPYITDYINNYTLTNIGCLKVQSWFFGSNVQNWNSMTVIENNRWRVKAPTAVNKGRDKCIIKPKNVHYFKIHHIKLGGDTLTLDPYNELRLAHYRSSNPIHRRFHLNYSVKDLSVLRIWKQINDCKRHDIECMNLDRKWSSKIAEN